jgi:Anti-sigma-D factor RsdA to sigma factor binding region
VNTTRFPNRRDDEHGGPFSAGGDLFRRRPEDADDSLDTTNEIPVDLAAVQADDALLNMLGSSDAGRGSADAELARVLVAWRRDVDSEPFGELLDASTAATAIEAGRRLRRRFPWRAVAAVLAALVIVAAGLGLLSQYAEPGDWLWPVHEVLYPREVKR